VSKRVEITFGNDGSISVEALGFEGAGCIEATKFMDELFGEPDTIDHKHEFYLKEYDKDCIKTGLCG